MLEDTRKRGASWLIYLVFGSLIVIFIINFGPQSQGSGQGCGGATAGTTLTVGDEEIPRSGFLFYYQGLFAQGSRLQRAEMTIDALTRRELLAQEAEARGLRVDDDLVDAAIKQGYIYHQLRREDVKPPPGQAATAFFSRVGDDVFFDYKSFKRWVSGIGLSVGAYKSVQKREMLAALMADMLEGSVQASRDEALAEFLYENTTVTFDAVAFAPAEYRKALRVTEADITRFLQAHATEIEAKYKADERLYKGVKPELALQWIKVARVAPAAPPSPPGGGSGAGSGSGSGSDAGSAAGSGSGAGSGADPIAVKDPGLDKLKAARADIVAKKKSFADVAKVLNEDENDRANAGELGWRSVDAPKLGDAALNAAVKGLAPGAVSEVITTDKGHFLLLARDKREGDLSYDQVKAELAADMAKDSWSKEAAKRAAFAALAEARGTAGKGKNLDEMFEKSRRQPPGGGGFEEILNNPNLTPEQKRQLFEKFREIQQGGGGLDGGASITVESDDILAKWGPGDGSSTGSATGSDAGSAGSAAGSGSGAGPDAGGAGDGPTEEPPVVASDDKLPELGTVTKPTVTRLGPVPKTRGELPDLGTSKKLVNALFDQMTPGMVGNEVYLVGDDYVVVQLADKQTPKIEEFEADVDHRIAMLREARGATLLRTWLKTRCDALLKDGKIKPDMNLFKDQDDKGNELPVTYQPCNF